MPQLHETRMGQQLFSSTLPRIATALERIAEALEKNLESEVSATNPPEEEVRVCPECRCDTWIEDKNEMVCEDCGYTEGFEDETVS